MRLETRNFGSIEVDEREVLEFEEGVPGFEETRKYVLIGTEDENSPFRWLQCLDNPGLAFALIDPFYVVNDYEVEITDEVKEMLQIEDEKDVLVYSIVTIPEDISKMSMNLRAPVVLNINRKRGAQVILDTDKYGVRHYILEELKKQRVSENASSYQEEGPVHCNK